MNRCLKLGAAKARLNVALWVVAASAVETPGRSDDAVQPWGRITTLMTPSCLSRNLAYISGASSKLAG